jgi:hypothetical protein
LDAREQSLVAAQGPEGHAMCVAPPALPLEKLQSQLTRPVADFWQRVVGMR